VPRIVLRVSCANAAMLANIATAMIETRVLEQKTA
jgi:hypothetical protein